MANVGFLGAGKMGIGMAGRLIRAGHTVRIYNRTKSKTQGLIDSGAQYCASPRLAATNSDVIISMLADDHVSRQVWLGNDGALKAKTAKNAIAIECSTISQNWALSLSDAISFAGLSYLDCPVTGLPDAAAKGELTLFLGGDHATIERAQPYLSPLSLRQVYFGEIGSATAYKLIANLMGSVQIIAAAEGLLTAEKAGLNLQTVAHELGIGGVGSPQVARIANLMVEAKHDTDIAFNAHLRLKDTQYGVDFSRQMGQSASLGVRAKSAFQALVDSGGGDLSESKVIDTLRANDKSTV